MEELFRSGSIDQNRSSANWPLAKILQRHGDAETGFKEGEDFTTIFLSLEASSQVFFVGRRC